MARAGLILLLLVLAASGIAAKRSLLQGIFSIYLFRSSDHHPQCGTLRCFGTTKGFASFFNTHTMVCDTVEHLLHSCLRTLGGTPAHACELACIAKLHHVSHLAALVASNAKMSAPNTPMRSPHHWLILIGFEFPA